MQPKELLILIENMLVNVETIKSIGDIIPIADSTGYELRLTTKDNHELIIKVKEYIK